MWREHTNLLVRMSEKSVKPRLGEAKVPQDRCKTSTPKRAYFRSCTCHFRFPHEICKCVATIHAYGSQSEHTTTQVVTRGDASLQVHMLQQQQMSEQWHDRLDARPSRVKTGSENIHQLRCRNSTHCSAYGRGDTEREDLAPEDASSAVDGGSARDAAFSFVRTGNLVSS